MDLNSEHATDFYLSSLEEQVRSELGDDTARLTQTTQGRITVDIREDLLEDFLNERQNNNWSQERNSMSKEMESLKAQLKEAQAKYVNLSEENRHLKFKMVKTCNVLRQTECELKQQTCAGKDKLDRMKEEHQALQKKTDKLDKVREENESLRGELEALKLKLRVEEQRRAVAENNHMVTAHSLKVELFEKDTAEFEARSKAEQLEADLAFERTQTQKIQAKLGKVEKDFGKYKEQAKNSAEEFKACQRTQQEELRKLSLALKKAESLLETKQVCLEQKANLLETMSKAKAFYVSQLDEQKNRNNNLLAARERAESQFESERSEWQRERSYLVQTTECLMGTMQDKEQEWDENRDIMKTHIQCLHSYVLAMKKKKREKWWKKLFLRPDSQRPETRDSVQLSCVRPAVPGEGDLSLNVPDLSLGIETN